MLDIIINLYPFLNAQRLKTELQALFWQVEFFANCKTVTELIQTIHENNLAQDVFEEVIKFAQIIVTTPMSSAESERCFSFLKRIKICLRNTMGEERLNALNVLSVERSLIENTKF